MMRRHRPPGGAWHARRARSARTLRTCKMRMRWRHHQRPAEAPWTRGSHSHWTGTWPRTVHPHWTSSRAGTIHPHRTATRSMSVHPVRALSRSGGGHSHRPNGRARTHHPLWWLHWVAVAALRAWAILRTTMLHLITIPTLRSRAVLRATMLHRRRAHCIARTGADRSWAHWTRGYSKSDGWWRERS